MLSELNHFSQSLHHGPTKEGTKQNGRRSREGIKAVLDTTTWIGTGKGAQAPEPWGPSLHRGARSCPSPQEAKFNPRGGPAQGLPPPAPTRPLLGRMGGRKARGKAAAAGGQQGRPFPAPAPREAQSSGRSCWGTSGASGGFGGDAPTPSRGEQRHTAGADAAALAQRAEGSSGSHQLRGSRRAGALPTLGKGGGLLSLF